jgi:hypothetical protein
MIANFNVFELLTIVLRKPLVAEKLVIVAIGGRSS